ncbi:MAG: DUF2283 domain-containing protein [Candidatus Omnitrophota bacterium]|jgi:uncharacterized protein YuzE
MLINIDTRAGAAYIKISEGKVAYTKELLPEVFVDYNSSKEILGIELISPCVLTLRKALKVLRLPGLNRIKHPLEELICHKPN